MTLLDIKGLTYNVRLFWFSFYAEYDSAKKNNKNTNYKPHGFTFWKNP